MKRLLILMLVFQPLFATAQEWIPYENTDPVTDERRLFLVREAEGDGTLLGVPFLGIGSYPRFFAVVIDWKSLVSFDRKVDVTYRIDSEASFVIESSVSGESRWTSIGLTDAFDMLLKLKTASRLVARVETVSNGTQTVVFQLGNLLDELKKYPDYFERVIE